MLLFGFNLQLSSFSNVNVELLRTGKIKCFNSTLGCTMDKQGIFSVINSNCFCRIGMSFISFCFSRTLFYAIVKLSFVIIETFECADIYNTLATAKNLEQLKNTWSEWQEVVLRNKKEFSSVLELISKSANLNGKNYCF